MKAILKITILILFLSSVAHADWVTNIINQMKQVASIDNKILNKDTELLNVEKDIDKLMKELNQGLTGHYGYGTFEAHDYQSYGEDASNWQSVLSMAKKGKGSGELGELLANISSQFPSDKDNFGTHQQYYALKSQTILATRAASELDYNKIQNQITYQQMLQHQIENTNDLKAALDLSNRIQVENNLINLQILRQIALTNQSQSITEQASINTAQLNARFLTKTRSKS